MYFLEFLETCTIGWVPFCEEGVGVGKRNTENAFFEFFLRRLSTTQPPALLVYPAGGDPSPQRTRTSYTSQAAAQAVPEPGRANTRADHRPNAGRATPVCTRHQTGHAWTIGTAAGLESGQRVRQTTLFRMQNIFHANVYKRCLCNLTFPWIHV